MSVENTQQAPQEGYENLSFRIESFMKDEVNNSGVEKIIGSVLDSHGE